MSRPTSKDQFETVYLRTNAVKKALAKVPSQQMAATLRDPQFKKCTAHIARSTFNKNTYVLLNHGFDYEDVEAVTRIYGLSFLGCDFVGNTDKDKYYLMMRYMNQRWEYFFLSMDRKFGIKDKLLDTSLDAFPRQIGEALASTSSQFEVAEAAPGPDVESLEEELQFLDMKVSLLRDMSANASSAAEKRQILKRKRLELADHGYVSDQVRAAGRRQRAANKKRQDTTAKLKERMSKEGPQHAEALCYHATSKHVPADVRNKAREYCRRFNLDYCAWASRQIANKGLDDKDFVL